MPKTKVEVYDKDQLIYPFIESDHVTFSNGMKVSEMLDQSISMPTVTHEDLSFKVGVGDQDVSSAIVDSSVSEMTIKGKTYQNILPEPSTHVLTNNKEMFKVNEGLDPNVEIVDGVSKSAILTGQTLVNVLSISNVSIRNGSAYSYNYNITPQVGEKYLIKIKINSIGVTTNTNPVKIQPCGGTGGGYFNITKKEYCVGNEITKIFTIVDGDNITNGTFTVWCRELSSGEFNADIIMIKYQQGMENWDIPYFQGMQSVKMPVLTTTGKNLFDGVLSQGWIGDATGESNTSHDGLHGSQYIKVNPSSVYTFKAESIPNGVTANSRFYFYDKNKTYLDIYRDGAASGSAKLINIPSDAHYMRFRFHCRSQTVTPEQFASCTIQIEEGSTATSYEPYKSNILHTPEEVVLRSLPNGVKDTLNLNTGEYVQRIGEVVLNGSEAWGNAPSYINGNPRFCYDCSNLKVRNNVGNQLVLTNSDTIISVPSDVPKSATKGVFHHNTAAQIHIFIPSSEIGGTTPSNFKTYLQQNPVTVQYELATPIVRTVDLSSSGNWDKVVLNGNETWSVHSNWSGGEFLAVQTQVANKLGGGLAFTDSAQFKGMSWKDSSVNSQPSKECVRYDSSGAVLYVFIKKSRLTGETVNDFKEWLQENPITVWYQTATHQGSTQVKQPIFFKDGHIIQSSRADNSLIPTLDYQAKTSNSYVMDLIKANTRYTMKAKTASGTFTIDGTSYGAGTNGTFTAPSSMANKLLVMSNKTNKEVMILEGDVTSKTIPYFKGIKSAFEGEDKIEVLSTGANIVDYLNPSFVGSSNMSHLVDNGEITLVDDATQMFSFVHIPINKVFNFKKGQKYHLSFEMQMTNALVGEVKIATPNVMARSNIFRYEINNEWTVYNTTITPQLDFSVNSLKQEEKGYETCLEFMLHGGTALSGKKTLKIRNVILSTNIVPYEPYKSNSTKIPLSSPLRSLPNGVCDELIIDRENNKATLIQKVGYSVINSEFAKNAGNWGNNKDTDPCWGFHCGNYVQGSFKLNEHNSMNDKLPIKGMATTGDPLMGYYQSNPHIAVRRVEACNLTMAKEWLDRNPIDFYYQLATPVITEVDMGGFPYIYKDGHIFLNSEIVPTTEIVYSINQCQQISASNEDIIRHEKELTYLQKLIAQYVQIDYESALLSLKV